MAIKGNFKGTTQNTFTVGKQGFTLHNGNVQPSNSSVSSGDLWVQRNASSVYLAEQNQESTEWKKLASEFSNFNFNELAANTFSGNGAQITNVDAVTLDGNTGDYYLDYENFQNTPSILSPKLVNSNVEISPGDMLVVDATTGDKQVALPANLAADEFYIIHAMNGNVVIETNNNTVRGLMPGDDIVVRDHESIMLQSTAEGSLHVIMTFPSAIGQGGAINADMLDGISSEQFLLQVDPPATSQGQPGDRPGLVSFDDDYVYYCISDYTGSSNIWKRQSWNDEIW